MPRQFLFTAATMLIVILAAGCTNFLFPERMTPVSGVVTISGFQPGDHAVEVWASGTPYRTLAKKDGSFQLALPAPGTYTIEARGDNVLSPSVAVSVRKDTPVTGVELHSIHLLPPPITLDFSDPTHRLLIQKPYANLDIEFKEDPFGDTALYFRKLVSGDQQYPPGGNTAIRFATLAYPEVDTFDMTVWQIGTEITSGDPRLNGGNRSLAVIFGYQDNLNYWAVYLTYSEATSVRRLINGVTHYICNPSDLDQWLPSNDEYQSARVVLERDGDNMVLTVLANGDPVNIDGCTFSAEEYTPGKLGLGGHGTSTNMAWFFKDITLDF